MPVNKATQDHGLIVAALFALVTNWNEAEIRAGRRGEYRTTGASMYRVRELTAEESGTLVTMCGALGLDLVDDDITELFSGDFEYQISYACNRFATKPSVGGQRLTSNEMRTLERARTILATKQDAAVGVLTRSDEQKAA